MANTDPISIDGLKEFRKALKDIDSDLPKALRIAFNTSAQDIVDLAQSNVPTKSHRAKNSIKTSSTQTKVRISGGSKRALYYAWLDFGGKVGKNRSVVRPFKAEGRYIYAAYYEKKRSGELVENLEKAIVTIATDAGLTIE